MIVIKNVFLKILIIFQNDVSVFYHFCGSTGTSHKVSLLLQRLVVFLQQEESSGIYELCYEKACVWSF